MATLVTLVDGTIPVAADFNGNFVALNVEVRPPGTGGTGQSTYATGDILYSSAANTLTRLPAGSTGQGLVMIAGIPAWRPVIVEQLTGLTISNGTDAVNDIDIAAGAATSAEATVATRMLMVNTATLTKQLDAAWAVGTNQGGLDTGAAANTTYHTHLIMRPDTGVVDALFSLSPTAPTMPTNYTKSRRIGSFLRVGGTILAFSQQGDEFLLKASILDVNAANPGTGAVSRTLSVPVGIVVWAYINAQLAAGSADNGLYVSSLDVNDETPSLTAAPLVSVGESDSGDFGTRITGVMFMRTNTAAQIRTRIIASAAGDTVRIATLGWRDLRGRG